MAWQHSSVCRCGGRTLAGHSGWIELSSDPQITAHRRVFQNHPCGLGSCHLWSACCTTVRRVVLSRFSLSGFVSTNRILRRFGSELAFVRVHPRGPASPCMGAAAGFVCGWNVANLCSRTHRFGSEELSRPCRLQRVSLRHDLRSNGRISTHGPTQMTISLAPNSSDLLQPFDPCSLSCFCKLNYAVGSNRLLRQLHA